MEGLAVAASIVAVVEIGSRVSYKLFAFSKQVLHARTAIEELAQEIASINVVLQQLVIQLKKDWNAPSKLCNNNLVLSAHASVCKCEKIFNCIDELITDGMEIKRLSLKQKIKFSYSAPKVKSHLASLDGLKLSLLLTLHTIVYAEGVRSREEGFMLSSQLQVLKSLYKEQKDVETKTHDESVVQAAAPQPSDDTVENALTARDQSNEHDTASGRTESPIHCSTGKGFVESTEIASTEIPVSRWHNRSERRRKKVEKRTARKARDDRFRIESRRRPVVPLCEDKGTVLYVSLIEDILTSINSVEYVGMDIRKRWRLHEVVLREHFHHMYTLLEPQGLYTPQEVTACFREGSTLMRQWLEKLRHEEIPSIRSRWSSPSSPRSSSSSSDYGAPIRITTNRVNPVAQSDSVHNRQHSPDTVVVNATNYLQLPTRARASGTSGQPAPVINNFYDADRGRSHNRRRRDSSSSSDCHRSRSRYHDRHVRKRYARRGSHESTTGIDADDDNVKFDVNSEDIKALLQSLTTLTPEEIATSLRVGDD